jgi:CheY-like chemotaxis protein
MKTGGTLTLRTGERVIDSKRWLRLEVEDTGTGMDEATRARIFEPFFTTKAPGAGTGLGLATVLQLTQALQGRVEVESEPGKGTRFVFHLPCYAEERASTGERAQMPSFRGRVLLVEDDDLVRASVRHYLEGMGLEVVDSGGAFDALDRVAARGEAIDLCVTDVLMPQMNGPQLLALLRMTQPNVRTLYMSSSPLQDLAGRGLIEPDALLLQKPFSQEELAQALASLLPPAQQPADRA